MQRGEASQHQDCLLLGGENHQRKEKHPNPSSSYKAKAAFAEKAVQERPPVQADDEQAQDIRHKMLPQRSKTHPGFRVLQDAFSASIFELSQIAEFWEEETERQPRLL